MKKNKFIIFSIVLVGLLTACTKDFNDMNVNPNEPTPNNVSPEYRFAWLQKVSALEAELHQRIHNLYVDQFSQYYHDDVGSDNYKMIIDWQNLYWNNFYRWVLTANEIIDQTKDKPAQVNFYNMTRIWKVWMFQRTTDLFGDVPYFNASNGSGVSPDYDSQQGIYTDLLSTLKDAVSKLDPAQPNIGKQDLVYNGDVAKWIKFGNSLRMRMAIRISQVDAALGKSHFAEALAGGVIENVEDQPSMPNYSGTSRWGSEYPIPMYCSWGELCMSKSMEKILSGIGGQPLGEIVSVGPAKADPRALKFFTTNNTSGQNVWRGTPSGPAPSHSSQPGYILSENSRPNITETMTKLRRLVLMPATEVWFLRAEAALRIWTSENTQTMYETGIKKSMAEFGITPAVVDLYIASTDKNLMGTSANYADNTGLNNGTLDKIITQKYIAGFPDNGWEAWADHRRLLRPALDVIEDPMSSGVVVTTKTVKSSFIQRIILPTTEKLNNYAKYQTVEAKDKVTERVWWASSDNINP